MAYPDKASYAGGMETAIDDEQFAGKLLEVSAGVEDAIRRTRLVDDKMLNDITKLYDWLKEFKILNGLETLKLWLDGRFAIGGYNFALAIQAHAKIPAPSAMGIQLSKEDAKMTKEIAMAREKRRAEKNEEEE